jgi:hypothetical protein
VKNQKKVKKVQLEDNQKKVKNQKEKNQKVINQKVINQKVINQKEINLKEIKKINLKRDSQVCVYQLVDYQKKYKMLPVTKMKYLTVNYVVKKLLNVLNVSKVSIL